jgi:hypothetical protein
MAPQARSALHLPATLACRRCGMRGSRRNRDACRAVERIEADTSAAASTAKAEAVIRHYSSDRGEGVAHAEASVSKPEAAELPRQLIPCPGRGAARSDAPQNRDPDFSSQLVMPGPDPGIHRNKAAGESPPFFIGVATRNNCL